MTSEAWFSILCVIYLPSKYNITLHCKKKVSELKVFGSDRIMMKAVNIKKS